MKYAALHFAGIILGILIGLTIADVKIQRLTKENKIAGDRFNQAYYKRFRKCETKQRRER